MDLVLLCMFVCYIASAHTQSTGRSVRVIQTDPSGNLLRDVNPLWMDNQLPPPPPNQDTITIDASIRFQKIVGFGAAFTDAASYTFSKASSENQQAILDAYWGDTNNSNHYTVARIVIGSCDYGLDFHSYDDSPGDTGLKNFSVSYDDAYIIPFIKRAYAKSGNSIKLLGSPWSPPAWMKTNNNLINGGSLIPTYYQVMANYVSKYIDEYKARGLPIWGVTPQNEPEFGPISYPGCLYTAQEEAAYIKTALGPVLAKNHPTVNILAYDHNRDHVYDWAKVLYSDPDVAKYLWGIAFHWYANLPYFENVQAAHDIATNKGLLLTEAAECNTAQDYWERGESFAYDIINDLNVWAQGFIQWNVLLQDNGKGGWGPFEGVNGVSNCQPPVVVLDGKVVKNPSYYFIGHFSRFLPPGSIRVHQTSKFSTPNLFATSFLNPNSEIVVIVQNLNTYEIDLKLSDSNNTALPKIPGKGVVTLIYKSFIRY